MNLNDLLRGKGVDPEQRFRAPNILLFQEKFEHSVGKLPLGFTHGLTRAKLH